jgi:hypothetical protein
MHSRFFLRTFLELKEMTSVVADVDQNETSTLAWGAVIAGGVVSAAVTLLLLALGVGLGLAAVSPWSDQGVSATTFHVGAGLYLVAIAMLASTVGGYLAGRLRMKWIGLHDDEVYFRDTAHGLATWALATVLSASVLGAATTHILSGAATGAGAAASTAAAANPVESYVDLLLRAEPGQGAPAPVGASGAQAPVRDELGRLFTPVLRKGGELAAADRTYAARVVAARTGLPQAEAERRVNDVIVQAKKAADETRKATMKLTLWLAASMLAGALAAMLAALEGGLLRDSKWYEPGWRATVMRMH